MFGFDKIKKHDETSGLPPWLCHYLKKTCQSLKKKNYTIVIYISF